MPPTLHPGVEPIAGYRLLERLGKGGFGEVWKCEAPGGLVKALKVVDGEAAGLEQESGADLELRSLQHVRTIRHPFLLSLDRIERVGRDLVIVMELADQSLQDRFEECRAAGLPGIPRTVLLRAFSEAAEALDLLNVEHGLQHLDVKPRNLLLVQLHVKLADFGLVRQLLERNGESAGIGPISPVYAAPEVFAGRISAASDQYSLAVAYCEMLTGVLPFDGKNCRQLAVQHTCGEPQLNSLPRPDREAIGRALAREPAERFSSCVEFMRALKRFTGSASGSLLLPGPALGPDALVLTPRPAREPGRPDGFLDSGTTAARSKLPADLSEYTLRTCRQHGALAEVWAAVAGKAACTVTLLPTPPGVDAAAWQRVLDELAGPATPGLVPIVAPHVEDGRSALASPCLGPTLRERFDDCRVSGLSGIPRGELLHRLGDAARTIDALPETRGSGHLALSPDRLQLVEHQTQVADFGLAWLWLSAGLSLGRGNPRYAPPELWSNEVDGPCDSYSLALIYQEMLTGKHPLQHGVSEADLSALPPAERPVLRRALDPAPCERFATCGELVEALTRVGPANGLHDPAEANRVIRAVIDDAAGRWQLREVDTLSVFLLPGNCLRHTFVARPPADPAGAIRDALAAHAAVRLLAADADAIHCRVPLASTGWHRFVGRQSGLDVQTRMFRRSSLPGDHCEARVEVRPFGNDPLRAAQLEETGPALLHAVRAALHADPERRGGDRIDCYSAVAVSYRNGATLPARVKDVSPSGICLYLPRRPDSDDLNVHLSPGTGIPAVPVAIRVVRVEPSGDGYEIGARFLSGEAG